jgi:hypothetical protein
MERRRPAAVARVTRTQALIGSSRRPWPATKIIYAGFSPLLTDCHCRATVEMAR